MCLRTLPAFGPLPWLCKLQIPGPVPGTVVMFATICKTLGAFVTPIQACIGVVHIIAADIALDLLLKKDKPPDTLTECSIQLKSME